MVKCDGVDVSLFRAKVKTWDSTPSRTVHIGTPMEGSMTDVWESIEQFYIIADDEDDAEMKLHKHFDTEGFGGEGGGGITRILSLKRVKCTKALWKKLRKKRYDVIPIGKPREIKS